MIDIYIDFRIEKYILFIVMLSVYVCRYTGIGDGLRNDLFLK